MSGSPKSPFSKLSLLCKQKPLRVVLLGQCGVGKTAMAVRFITKRYIGEYDPNLEKIYNFNSTVGDELLSLEVLDTAGHQQDKEYPALEMNIRWGDMFIIMYSVTDKCSFDECNRLRFLINYNKGKKRKSSLKDPGTDIPVCLVGNKNDQFGERMVSFEEGMERSKEIGCFSFHEISVRESISQVNAVFLDLWHYWKIHSKLPKIIKRSGSDIHASGTALWTRYADMKGGEANKVACDQRRKKGEGGSLPSVQDADETEDEFSDVPRPFRERASTDGTLLVRPNRWTSRPTLTNTAYANRKTDRRMSISMKGNNVTY